MNTWESVAIIIATVAGPVLAVLVSLWREKRRAKQLARFNIFRTLMSTRRIALTREHVDALNLIETDFYGEENVQKAFRDYIAHLGVPSTPTNDTWWHDTRLNKLSTLLHQLSLAVGMSIGEIEIRSGGYSPSGWANKDLAEAFVLGLANGSRHLPVQIVNLPPLAAVPPPPASTPPPGTAGPSTPGMRTP